MSHTTLTADLEDWLTAKALAGPDIVALFQKLCERLNAIGIPLDRAVMSWPTLHPLFRAEMVFWERGGTATLEQYFHSTAGNEYWLKSPFHHANTHQIDSMRRTLTGPNAMLDFEVLESFAAQGYSDYLLTRSIFRVAEVKESSYGATGMMASWATRRANGFSDDDLDALRRIQKLLAVACHASIQRRVLANVANAYLGPTAGWRVLAGDIKRGDGDMIPAVVWFSDMRHSTRLSDTMDPDSYLQLLNRYFECTAQPVIDHGGEILNFIGDGVLGIFPIDGEGATAAAARAEAAVHDARRLREEALSTGTPGNAPLDFGIGLAIGEVMFGNIGVRSRLAFSGIGKIVNTVQRVETATKALGLPVLALKKFAEAAPGNWTVCGDFEIEDFDKRLTVYTLDLAESAPATGAAQATEAAE